MNIENIAALAAQLQSLGFDDPGLGLLRRICFRPGSFILTQSIQKGGAEFVFHIKVEKDHSHDTYHLKYYDAILQKENVWQQTEINGINLREIESMMSVLDWKMAFDFDEQKHWNAADKTSWEKELKIEAIIEALGELEATEEGKAFANHLKIKYWRDMPYQEVFSNIMPGKNKNDVSQRFYLSADQPGISASEAIRFLQNRWLDKQIQAKKKIAEIPDTEKEESGSSSSGGSGLLKRKRLNGNKGSKKNNLLRN